MNSTIEFLQSIELLQGFEETFGVLMEITWRDLVDIALVGFIIYRILLLLRGTKALPALTGLTLVIAMYFLAGELGLHTLHWLLTQFLGSLLLVIIILFQNDVRRALMEFGAGGFFRRRRVSDESVDTLVAAVMDMAEKRIGALIVIERNVPLGDLLERGVMLNADLSKELLNTIFFPNTALHDGAVILRGSTVLAAGCILPLASGIKGRSSFGTRHRAAVGVTEETDAVSVVVSEERGAVSVAVSGKLTTTLDEVRLKRALKRFMQE